MDLRKENLLESRCVREQVWVYIIQIICAVSKCGYAHVLLYVYVYMGAVAIQCVHVCEERWTPHLQHSAESMILLREL